MELTCIARDTALAPSLGDLVLKVHGGPADGEIVRFGQGKSTVGSDASCTYRICDDQIQSVHCLILRGTGGSVVRRWADGISLNGKHFVDSHLETGDRLLIGAIEMEVIEDSAQSTPHAEIPLHRQEPSPSEFKAQQTDGLQLMEEAWREMREGLHREITRLQEDRQTWQDQRACWETEMTGYRAALSDLVRQFDEFQQLRQQDRDTWLEEIHQLQTLIEASADATRELPVNDAALLGEDTIEPLDGCDEGFTPDKAHEARLDRFICDEPEPVESEETSNQEEEPWGLPQDEANDARIERFVSDELETPESGETLEPEEDPWGVPQEEEHDARIDRLVSDEMETPESGQTLEHEGETWGFPQEEEHDARIDRFVSDEMETSESEEALGQEQESWGLPQDESHDARIDRFVCDTAEPPANEEALEQEEDPWRLPQDEAHDAKMDRSVSDEVDTAKCEVERQMQEEGPCGPEHEGPLQQQSAFLSDTFGVGEGCHEELTDAMPAEASSTPDVSYLMEDDEHNKAPHADGEPVTTKAPGWLDQYQEQQDGADSSISDYMNRLLQRVGGNDDAASHGNESDGDAHVPTPANAPSAEPVAEAAGPAAQPETSFAGLSHEQDDVEFTPRHPASERSSDLAAMRELANASARNAIHACDKKRTAKSAMGRLPVLALELGCGGLLSFWAYRTGHALAYAGAAICFMAAAMTTVSTVLILSRTALAALRLAKTPRDREHLSRG